MRGRGGACGGPRLRDADATFVAAKRHRAVLGAPGGACKPPAEANRMTSTREAAYLMSSTAFAVGSVTLANSVFTARTTRAPHRISNLAEHALSARTQSASHRGIKRTTGGCGRVSRQRVQSDPRNRKQQVVSVSGAGPAHPGHVLFRQLLPRSEQPDSSRPIKTPLSKRERERAGEPPLSGSLSSRALVAVSHGLMTARARPATPSLAPLRLSGLALWSHSTQRGSCARCCIKDCGWPSWRPC